MYQVLIKHFLQEEIKEHFYEKNCCFFYSFDRNSMIGNFIRSKSGKKVSIVFFGTAVAQIIPILMLPVLTRIFTPQEFGDLAVASAIAALGVIFATGRYEFSLMQAKKILQSKRLFGLSFILVCIFTIVYILFFTLFGSELNNQFDLKISLIKPDGSEANISSSGFELSVNKEKFTDQNIDISSPVLWSPQSPQSYIIQIQIWQKETLIDESRQSLAVYSLSADKDSLIFNGSSFTLNGVTYIPSTYDLV